VHSQADRSQLRAAPHYPSLSADIVRRRFDVILGWCRLKVIKTVIGIYRQIPLVAFCTCYCYCQIPLLSATLLGGVAVGRHCRLPTWRQCHCATM